MAPHTRRSLSKRFAAAGADLNGPGRRATMGLWCVASPGHGPRDDRTIAFEGGPAWKPNCYLGDGGTATGFNVA